LAFVALIGALDQLFTRNARHDMPLNKEGQLIGLGYEVWPGPE